jgi:hypothetical protein
VADRGRGQRKAHEPHDLRAYEGMLSLHQ